MSLTSLLDSTDLENSLLIGYYGGGNYGDELLLEILQNLLAMRGIRHVHIAYQYPEHFTDLHHDLGYQPINIRSKRASMRAIAQSKNIIVGGGGLWGVDMNINTLLMSLMLLIARRVFRKHVYLLGVGYYNSTPRIGRIAAWMAGHAANVILARDPESLQNFRRVNRHAEPDTDIAFYARDIDAKKYARDVTHLEKVVPIRTKSLFITLRRTQNKRSPHEQTYNRVVQELLARILDKPVIVIALELERTSPDDYERGRQWQTMYPNSTFVGTTPNPLALFFLMQKRAKKIVLIGPQFHIILTAYMHRVAFLPLVYDNKVDQLYDALHIHRASRIQLHDLTCDALEAFVEQQWSKS